MWEIVAFAFCCFSDNNNNATHHQISSSIASRHQTSSVVALVNRQSSVVNHQPSIAQSFAAQNRHESMKARIVLHKMTRRRHRRIAEWVLGLVVGERSAVLYGRGARNKELSLTRGETTQAQARMDGDDGSLVCPASGNLH